MRQIQNYMKKSRKNTVTVNMKKIDYQVNHPPTGGGELLRHTSLTQS